MATVIDMPSAGRRPVAGWPDAIAPMLAAKPSMRTVAGAVGLVADRDWCAYERKHDGWRVLVHRTADRVAVQTRSGKWMHGAAIDRLAAGFELVPAGTVLDGELLDAEDRTRPRPGSARPLTVVFFDVLSARGEDLTGWAYRDRRMVLGCLESAGLELVERTFLSDRAAGWLTEAADDPRFDGVVAKPLGSVYLPGKRGQWGKAKP